MWFMKLTILQPFVVLSLFIAFLLVFGLPAYDRYRSNEIYIKESVVESQVLEAPALTICVDAVKKKLLGST